MVCPRKATVHIILDEDGELAVGKYEFCIPCTKEECVQWQKDGDDACVRCGTCSATKKLAESEKEIVETDGLDAKISKNPLNKNDCINVCFDLHPEEDLNSAIRLADIASEQLRRRVTNMLGMQTLNGEFEERASNDN